MIVNKKARFEYHFIDTYIAGMALQGTDVKDIINGKFSLVDAYCVFKGNELFLNEIKLLLNRKELNKLQNGLIKGTTIIPYKIFKNEKGKFKLELSLSKGKKLYDKREVIKQRDIQRENGK